MTHTSTEGCDEFVNLEKRAFIEGAMRGIRGLAGRTAQPATAATTAVSSSVAFAQSGTPVRDVIVFVMLRGGMDGLSFCVPHADPDYASMRGPLAVPPPGQLNGAIDLDGFFGLNPAAAALLPIYQSGELAIVNTAGSTNESRSHFDAMRFIEGGTPDPGTPPRTDGWLGRHLAGVAPVDPNASLRGVAIDWTAPQTILGGPKTLTIPDPSNFDIGGHWNTSQQRQDRIAAMYAERDDPIRSAALDSLSTISTLAAIDFNGYTPTGGAVYPVGDLGGRFERAAALIKAGIGVEAIEIDRGAWDHHDDLGPINGQFATMIAELSEALAAFYTDLGSLTNSVTIAVMSEFGRRVDANGSGGTDHGRGGCMLLLGGNVNGGQIVHDWPGLDPQVLDDLALPVRIDYRDVLIEVLRDRAAHAGAAAIFPGHAHVDWGLVRS